MAYTVKLYGKDGGVKIFSADIIETQDGEGGACKIVTLKGGPKDGSKYRVGQNEQYVKAIFENAQGHTTDVIGSTSALGPRSNRDSAHYKEAPAPRVTTKG